MKEGMKMPGFTAETSLYKPGRHYDIGVNRGADGAVIPQADIKADRCNGYKPEDYSSPAWCYYDCMQDPYCGDGKCQGYCDYTPPPPPTPNCYDACMANHHGNLQWSGICLSRCSPPAVLR